MFQCTWFSKDCDNIDIRKIGVREAEKERKRKSGNVLIEHLLCSMYYATWFPSCVSRSFATILRARHYPPYPPYVWIWKLRFWLPNQLPKVTRLTCKIYSYLEPGPSDFNGEEKLVPWMWAFPLSILIVVYVIQHCCQILSGILSF